jgi:hypothetical protein
VKKPIDYEKLHKDIIRRFPKIIRQLYLAELKEDEELNKNDEGVHGPRTGGGD